MGEIKHTPGPWVLCFHLQSAQNDASCTCGYRGGIWGADEERIVCEMGSTVTPGQEGMEPARYQRPTELANARLIAAAPDLLEALKAMQTVMDMGPAPRKLDDALTWRQCDEKARALCDAAIARAEGRS